MVMDRRRKSSSKGSIADELAVVKAAAWAWYERGSGSEGRAIREFDLSMPRKTDPKPSRYKLEAMKESQEIPPPPPLSPPSSTATNSEISLLDEYEIDRISKQLDLYIESSRAQQSLSSGGGDHGHYAHNKVASLSENGTSEGKSKPRKSNNSRGFWSKYAAICRSRGGEVVEVGRSFKVTYLRGGSRKRI